MELREAISEQSRWERKLYSTLLVSTPREVPLAIAWFEELVARSEDARPLVELAVLEAESGLTQKVAGRVVEWKQLNGDFPIFAKIIEIAYLEAQDPRDPTEQLDLSILDQLETRWFHDRLIARLSRVRPDVLSRHEAVNSRHLLASIRIYAGSTMLILVAGLLSLFWILARVKSGTTEMVIGTAVIPPSWSGRTALAIILRCAAFLLLLVVGIGIFVPVLNVDAPLVLVGAYLVGVAVLFKLSRKYLLDGSHKNILEATGVSIVPGKWNGMVPWIAVLAAAGIVGDLGIVWIADFLGVRVHWTEWFDEDLVWGNHLELTILLIAIIVGAPIFEELLFRGLIFQTLRQKYSFGIAAGLSAVLFSVLHGYSIAGFFALVWTGFVWAWSVEKTKSLLPAMIAHSLHNLVMAVGLILFLRG
jgi:membrane protease YdiL (CAAX protease family)